MDSADIRSRWLDFFESKNSLKLSHTVVPSASLIASDPNLLLVNAGMVPFKPFFLGEVKPPYKRATSVQKCVRTLDIDEVGKTTRHASFFQMCGNFSFGDYFKEGAIALAWELLTKSTSDGGYGFSEDKLWVTVYEDDDEAADIWHKQVGVPKNRIQRRGMADNFWSMGVPGPCGPCSEIYFDRGSAYGKEGGPIADEDRYLEIWNLVFMQNIRGEGGDKNSFPIVGELPAKNIDTGLGLERTAALLQGVENIYEIDTTKIIFPGNEGRGYVLRRMMRRTIRNMRLLGSQDLVISELIKSSIQAMGPQYPELISGSERILAIAEAEEETFTQTLKSGTSIFDIAATQLKSEKSKSLSADTVFKLHDTYGFPFDLTLEMAREQGLGVDEMGFRKLMNEQRDRAKADAKSKKSGHTDLTEYRGIVDKSGSSKFIGYDNISAEATITGLLVDGKSVSEANIGSEIEITLDRTPFYAEGGGQLADGGKIQLSNGAIIQVEDVQSPLPGLIVHRGNVVSGVIKAGASVVADIDLERRLAISRAHTATHLVHKAFREALGETATQAGSENAPGRFRFDFPSTSAVPEALVGHDAYQYLAREHVLLNSLTEIIKGARADELPQRISELVEKMKSMEKELSAVRSAKALAATSQIANKSQKIQDVNLIIEQLESEIAVDDMRSIAINLREKVKSGVVVLSTISAGKPLLVAAVSSEAIKLGIKAGELIKIGSATLGGGGGGKDDFAQGGGVDPSAIPKAFKEITKLIEGKFN